MQSVDILPRLKMITVHATLFGRHDHLVLASLAERQPLP
jgi:hypothetical protein